MQRGGRVSAVKRVCENMSLTLPDFVTLHSFVQLTSSLIYINMYMAQLQVHLSAVEKRLCIHGVAVHKECV